RCGYFNNMPVLVPAHCLKVSNVLALKQVGQNFIVRIAVNGIGSPPVNATLDSADAANTGLGTIGAGSSGGTWVTYAYSPNGLRKQMDDNQTGTSRTTKYAYDDLGRLKVKSAPEGTLSYQYDAGGSVTEVSARHSYNFTGITPWLFTSNQQTQNNRMLGAHMSYQYDGRHRLWKVYSDQSLVAANLRATYTYDPIGNLAKTIYGDSGGTPVATTTYTYNTRNQLGFLKVVANAAGSTLASFDYDDMDTSDGFVWPATRKLAASGQRLGVREVLQAAGTAYPRLVGNAYDPLLRLTKESLFTSAFATESGYVQYDGAAGYGDTSGYDPVGNRRQRTVSSFGGVVGRTNSTYDANDRLGGLVSGKVAASWNASGDTLQFDLDASGAYDQGVADSYDAEHRLISAVRTPSTVSLIYDGDGNRVKKSVVNGGTTTTYYLVDDRNPSGYAQVLEEQSTAGGTPTVRYVYGLDLVNQDRNGTLSYYGYDGLGTARCLIGGSIGSAGYQLVTDSYTFDAFGILTARYARRTSDGVMLAFADPASETAPAGTTPVDNNYRYTGEQWDKDLGMYYLRARYYSPDLGRFWNMDSYEGSQSDPFSLHKYLYASANPVNRVDPSGHFDIVIFTVGNAIRGGIAGATFV
ncbi:MAG: RHS repeat-associated core domain-containing protein, partial [Proteobacteria bacterium]|nr:RHS repeat-associated core domain-containing protein [Pseudomonadota bacterium]